jgi:hypothetical protein
VTPKETRLRTDITRLLNALDRNGLLRAAYDCGYVQSMPGNLSDPEIRAYLLDRLLGTPKKEHP